jgi:hypothetical protein
MNIEFWNMESWNIEWKSSLIFTGITNQDLYVFEMNAENNANMNHKYYIGSS